MIKNLEYKKLVNDILVCLYIPLLPMYVNGIYNHLGVKIGRLGGAIAIIVYVTDLYILFPYNISLFIRYFAVIQILHIFVLSSIKVGYGLYLLFHINYIFEYKGICFSMLYSRIIIIFVLELVGLVVYDLLWEVITHMYDIKSISKKNKYKNIQRGQKGD